MVPFDTRAKLMQLAYDISGSWAQGTDANAVVANYEILYKSLVDEEIGAENEEAVIEPELLVEDTIALNEELNLEVGTFDHFVWWLNDRNVYFYNEKWKQRLFNLIISSDPNHSIDIKYREYIFPRNSGLTMFLSYIFSYITDNSSDLKLRRPVRIVFPHNLALHDFISSLIITSSGNMDASVTYSTIKNYWKYADKNSLIITDNCDLVTDPLETQRVLSLKNV